VPIKKISKQIVRQAANVIEDYGMDYSDDESLDALGVWFDRQYKQLVIEDEHSRQQQRFDLTDYILDEVEAYVKTQALKKYGNRINSISASNKSRRKRGLTFDDIVVKVETESGLRELVHAIVSALQLRAGKPDSDSLFDRAAALSRTMNAGVLHIAFEGFTTIEEAQQLILQEADTYANPDAEPQETQAAETDTSTIFTFTRSALL
jgi:beta-phosphoglucomutase-like phosphatase (HAD superfamily)